MSHSSATSIPQLESGPRAVLLVEGDAPHLTDAGNAKRLVALYGDSIRYCHPWKLWLVWDGVRWAPDDSEGIIRLAKVAVQSIYAEASEAGEPARRKELSAHAMKSEAEAKIKSMVSLAKSEEGIPISPSQLDTDPFKLNVLGGTIDLRTGQLDTHRPEDYITKLAPVEFDPDAKAERFAEFLKQIFCGDKNIIRFVQRAVGYTLTGDTREQCLFLLWGDGANGKTTFIETIRALLGDYGKATPFSTFLVKNNDGPGNDIARLQGARAVVATEGNRGRGLDEALVKKVTGQDTIATRFFYKEFFEFIPAFKVFLVSNNLPRIDGTDHAIWRRLHKIRFDKRIPLGEQDKCLGEKLKAELPGILNWAIDGCLDWQKNGLEVPEEVKAATEAYREEENALAPFIEDCCTLGPAAKATVGDLHEAYLGWCERNLKTPLPTRQFGDLLANIGFPPLSKKGTGGIRYRKGIALKDSGE